MKQAETFEELLVSLIAKDKTIQAILIERIKEAIKVVEISGIVADQMQQTIEAVFEENALYSCVEEAIGDGITAVLCSYFQKNNKEEK